MQRAHRAYDAIVSNDGSWCFLATTLDRNNLNPNEVSACFEGVCESEWYQGSVWDPFDRHKVEALRDEICGPKVQGCSRNGDFGLLGL